MLSAFIGEAARVWIIREYVPGSVAKQPEEFRCFRVLLTGDRKVANMMSAIVLRVSESHVS